MTVAFIDAQLLVHPNCSQSSAVNTREYVDRISCWLEAEWDLRIGPGGREYLLSVFGQEEWPQNSLEFDKKSTSKLIVGFIQKAMSRAYSLEFEGAVGEITPKYIFSGEALEALFVDVFSMNVVGIGSLASTGAHWDSESDTLLLDNQRRINLLLDPSTVSSESFTQTGREYFHGKRIFLVGGLADPAFIADLSNIGIEYNQVVWIELEKNKSSAILKQKLAGVRGDEAIIACWSGQMDHDAFRITKKISAQRSVPHIWRETLPEVREQLVLLADI